MTRVHFGESGSTVCRVENNTHRTTSIQTSTRIDEITCGNCRQKLKNADGLHVMFNVPTSTTSPKVHREDFRSGRSLCNVENNPNHREQILFTRSSREVTCSICVLKQNAPRETGFRKGGKSSRWSKRLTL